MTAPTRVALTLWTGVEWREDLPAPAEEQGLHASLGRGGYLIMCRGHGDVEGKLAGDRGAGKAAHAHRIWRRDAKPTAYMDAVEALFHPELGGDGRPRTLHRVGMELLGKEGDLVGGTPLEEALWLCVKAKSLRWCVAGPGVVYFAPWHLGATLDAPVRVSGKT
jgi:hypothetical protein